MFWGDRYGQLRDPFGQMWSFGWPAKLTEAQKEKLRVEAMAQMAKR
jgi:PhnB protein